MKKQILSIAIIATLPLTAMADVGPAAVPSNGTAVVATANPPYQTLPPSNDDKQHIASTAYVKGAYNDAIAAVNKVDSDKQAKLMNASNNDPIVPKVLTGNITDGMTAVLFQGTGQEYAAEYTAMAGEVAYSLTGVLNASGVDDALISAGTVMQWMRETGDAINDTKLYNSDGDRVSTELMHADEFEDRLAGKDSSGAEDKLVSAKEVLDVAIDLSNKRVKIYTTWDDDRDSATRLVEFATAQ